MPVIFNQTSETSQLGLWKISETIDEFLQISPLTEVDRQRFEKIKNGKRKLEWLAVRALLGALAGRQMQIEYYASGKPFVENEANNISISHTKGLVGILLSSNVAPGLDIELNDRPVNKVLSRFLSEKELQTLKDTPSLGISYWCAKECVFKAIDAEDVDFASEIDIQILNNDDVVGHFTRGDHCVRIPMRRLSINDYVLVYTV